MKKAVSGILSGIMLMTCTGIGVSANGADVTGAEGSISRIVDLSGKYNQHGIYSSAENDTGSLCGLAFDYASFKNTENVPWDNEWVDGQIDNTLTLDGVQFKMRVIDHNNWTNKDACVWWNNEGGESTNFDVEDGYYTSLDILANCYEAARPYLTVKLNYEDGTSETVQRLLWFVYHDDYSNGRKFGVKMTQDYMGTGYIGNYSIPTDSSKKLVSADIYNSTYVPEDNSEGRYPANVCVYAMTLVQSRELYNSLIAGEIEEAINGLPINITYADKAVVDVITEKIEAAKANGVNVETAVSNYSVYVIAVKKLERLAPVSKMIDLSKKYNQHGIYSSAENDTGSLCGLAFDYASFKNTENVPWDNEWVDGQIDNTLTLGGIQFNVRVIDHSNWSNKDACVWWNNEGGESTNFDVEDGYYTSLDILANCYEAARPYLTVRLNYEDGTSETVQRLLWFVYHDDYSNGGKFGVKMTQDYMGIGYIGNYSIPADSSKKLVSADIFNTGYVPEDNSEGRYPSYVCVYAMTLVQTKELENKAYITAIEDAIDLLPMNITYADKDKINAITEMINSAVNKGIDVEGEVYNYSMYLVALNRIDGLTPVSKPVDLSGKYNQHGMYSSIANDGGSLYGTAFDYESFKNTENIPWDNEWKDGQIDNTLTLGTKQFKMRVIDHNGWSNNDSCVWWNYVEEGDFTNFDLNDGYYTSLEILANCYEATRPYMTVKLNYEDGTSEEVTKLLWFAFHDDYADGEKFGSKMTNGQTGYIGNYSIPVDSSKKLVGIDIYNDKYVPEGYTGDKYPANVCIYAMTLMTTKSMAEENEKDAFTFDGADVEVTDSEFIVSGNLTKNGDVDYAGVLVLTVMDNNGKLLEVKTTVPEEASTPVYENFKLPNGEYNVSYMIWRSLKDMTPVCSKTVLK